MGKAGSVPDTSLKTILYWDTSQISDGKKYTNISLLDELINEIDKVVKKSKLGYKNRADLCKEAIRNFLRELAVYENSKKALS